MFVAGDLVTGKDRSYRRSIYKFLSQDGDRITLKIVCFSGQLYIHKHEENMVRLVKDFRLASKEEVHSELSEALSKNLIDFVKTLLKVRRSSLGRRLLERRDFRR